MKKRLSPLAIDAFKGALAHLYWYKKDLKNFLITALGDTVLVNTANWELQKWPIVSSLVDTMCANQDRYQDTLLFLMREVAKVSDFAHLLRLEDGAKKARDAREAVTKLRSMMKTHEQAESEERISAERRSEHARRQVAIGAVSERLAELHSHYVDLATRLTPQQRGFALEKLMYDLFNLFDLDPKASFRITGEQIDGAFSLQGCDYLFEAKWAGLVSASEMDTFAAKVQRKLDNTLGLMLSMDSFQPDGVTAHSKQRRVLLLMTGLDLMMVFEGRIDFAELLVRKRRHASQTGEILFQFFQM